MGRLGSVSVIAMTHDRDGTRTLNFAASLLEQTVVPDEIIVVDTTPNRERTTMRRAGEERLYFIFSPMPTFNKSRALNIGIRASKSDTIMVTDIDLIFSPNVIETVTKRASPKTFVLAEAGYLPDIPIERPFDWPRLVGLATDIARHKSPGAVQATHRDFFFNVRGYDEQYSGGLGGMDDDMWSRAYKYGLELVWIPFGEMHCLHQWHPVSPLKGKCSHLFTPDPPIIKNPTGWGEWN